MSRLALSVTAQQTRCFCHVVDVVDALAKLMDAPAAIGQVYNVGGEEEVSINELAKRVILLAGSKSSVKHISYEQAYGHRFEDMARRAEARKSAGGDWFHATAKARRDHSIRDRGNMPPRRLTRGDA